MSLGSEILSFQCVSVDKIVPCVNTVVTGGGQFTCILVLDGHEDRTVEPADIALDLRCCLSPPLVAGSGVDVVGVLEVCLLEFVVDEIIHILLK